MSAIAELQRYFRVRDAMAIAVSGGVDSMTLAVVAARENPATQIFHAVSPAVPVDATARVKRYAAQENWRLNLIDAGETSDPDYVANPANRCYHCKTNLYATVTEHTDLQVASGTNLDDLGDYRPGLVAADEHGVCHPYVELGIDKAGLRDIAGELALADLKDLPAAPCLASRVTTGIAIDAKLLPVIDEAEQLIREIVTDASLAGVRCRVRPDAIAVQLEASEPFERFTPYVAQVEKSVAALFRERGYADFAHQVVVEPYRRGSAFLIETLEVG